ncbi:MAG: carbamoyltransferase HypF, partial [Coriobacteriales bacterium]|nr:carbamoyltransferase HypF [Coriobacteriales bacterium]
AVVEMTVNVAEYFRQLHGIDTVALSGGVFMNRFLIEKLPAALSERGFKSFWNRQLPPNDGCIAYGQAAVAAAQITMKG